MKKISKNKSNGITLIALVVTIVVLLILAGVTITFVLGEGGILDMAKEAAEKTNKAIESDQDDIKSIEETIYDVLDPFLPNTVEESIKKGRRLTETRKIKDNNENEMWVPKGFTVTEGNRIDEGVVVKDPQGNEFVWVPVETIGDMVYCYEHTDGVIKYDDTKNKLVCETCEQEGKTTNFAGKLYASSIGNSFNADTPNTGYNTGESGYTGLREPDTVSVDSSNSTSVKDGTYTDFKEQLQDEFNKMATSVAKYKGFYIGRYETSGLKDNETPTVKPGAPTVSTTWYTMYKNSKNLAQTGSEVTSSMIWGCQWDQVMLWMKDVENPTITDTTKYYIKDSSGMGWYKDTTGDDGSKNDTHLTGIDLKKEINGKEEVLNRVKNIYDLAGNMWEWTLDAFNPDDRVSRGGNYPYYGYGYPASQYGNANPKSRGDRLSSRAVLYIN